MATSPGKPALSLGLSFLFLGGAYAIPLTFPVHQGSWLASFSPEIVTVYRLVGWMGMTHFIYAYWGQPRAVRVLPNKGWTFGLALLVAGLVLLLFLRLLGIVLFSALTWIYFVAHFVKAERMFGGSAQDAKPNTYLQPVVAFAWFSAALFNVADIQNRPWLLLGSSILLALSFLYFGGWRSLTGGETLLPVVALFLIGEALVWATYAKYMTPQFRVGVYVFHIAIASFYHYFSTYFFAAGRRPVATLLKPGAIVTMNLSVISLGGATILIPALYWLNRILGAEVFTFWVALHLVSSDLFPVWKRQVVRA